MDFQLRLPFRFVNLSCEVVKMHRNAATMHLLICLVLNTFDYERRVLFIIGGRRLYPAAGRVTGIALQAFNGWQFRRDLFVSVAACHATQSVLWNRLSA